MIMSATTIRSRVHESELVVGSRGIKYAIISRNDLQSWIIENKNMCRSGAVTVIYEPSIKT